jgi:hypothetical protein
MFYSRLCATTSHSRLCAITRHSRFMFYSRIMCHNKPFQISLELQLLVKHIYSHLTYLWPFKGGGLSREVYL